MTWSSLDKEESLACQITSRSTKSWSVFENKFKRLLYKTFCCMGKISGKQPVTPLYLKSSMVFDISFKSQNARIAKPDSSCNLSDSAGGFCSTIWRCTCTARVLDLTAPRSWAGARRRTSSQWTEPGESCEKIQLVQININALASVTRLDDLLDFVELLKAFGSN